MVNHSLVAVKQPEEEVYSGKGRVEGEQEQSHEQEDSICNSCDV